LLLSLQTIIQKKIRNSSIFTHVCDNAKFKPQKYINCSQIEIMMALYCSLSIKSSKLFANWFVMLNFVCISVQLGWLLKSWLKKMQSESVIPTHCNNVPEAASHHVNKSFHFKLLIHQQWLHNFCIINGFNGQPWAQCGAQGFVSK